MNSILSLYSSCSSSTMGFSFWQAGQVSRKNRTYCGFPLGAGVMLGVSGLHCTAAAVVVDLLSSPQPASINAASSSAPIKLRIIIIFCFRIIMTLF